MTFDEEATDARCCTHHDLATEMTRPHEHLEVLDVGGRSVVRRHLVLPCPDHVEAIRRARAFRDTPLT